MKKVLTAFFTAVVMAGAGHAMDFSVDVNPGMVFPSGKCADTLKGPAAGADLAFNFHILDRFTVGPEFGFDYIIKDGDPSYVMDFAPGVKIGMYMYPWGQFGFGVNAAAGIHFASYDYPGEKNASGTGYKEGREPAGLSVCNPYIRAEVSANYRLNSSLSVGLRGGYVIDFFDGHDFDDGFSPFMAGPELGVGIRYSFSNVKPENRVEAETVQDAPVFPVLMSIYKDVEFGSITVSNMEGVEIKNVRVYFKAAPYTSSTYFCGKAKRIPKGKTYTFPLKAEFSKELAKFADDGSFPGEITVKYNYMGDERTITRSTLVTTYNRNAMNWSDPNGLAAFVCPTDETVLELAKHAGSIAKSNQRTGFNSKLQSAIYMAELFNTLGLSRVTDKATPYSSMHLNTSKNDSIQYPFQTFQYMSGDSDELAIVLASLLQAVSVDCALIPLNNDMIVAVELGMTSKAVGAIFENPDLLVLIGDEYYLPLSINSIGKGFNESWKAAAASLKQEMAKKIPDFVVLKDAWQIFPSLEMSARRNVVKPSASTLVARGSRELETFMAENLRPKIKTYEALVSSGKAKDEDRISLGLLYVRTGEINSASIVFKNLADKGNISAMNNLANIYILQKDYASAEKWYKQVLENDKDNSVAKNGLDRIANEK